MLVAMLADQSPGALAEAFVAVPRAVRDKTRRGAEQVRARLLATNNERAAELLVAVVL